MTWLMRIILTSTLGWSAILAAAPSDECRLQKMRLPYSEVQSHLIPLFQAIPISPKEQGFAQRFKAWASKPLSNTYALDALQLSVEIQRYLVLERRPSPGLKLMWASILLASQQTDVANRTLSQLPLSDLQLFLRAEVLKTPAAYRLISTKNSSLLAFVNWRLSEMSLEQGSITEAWQSFTKALSAREMNTLSSPQYLQKAILDFGTSRLEPQTLWANIPTIIDKEWLSICILTLASGESQKQVAFRNFNELQVVTDRSLNFASQGLSVLREKKASLQSQVGWTQTILWTLAKHSDPKSKLRQKLLEETEKNVSQIIDKDNRSEGHKLSAALAQFMEKAPSSEALPFRYLKAKLHENMGDFARAGTEYKTIWLLKAKGRKDPQLAEVWLNSSQRAAPAIEGDKAPLNGAALVSAKTYLEACDAYAEVQRSSSEDQRGCAAYSIQLAINQKDSDLAIRRLWLFVSRFPKESPRIVAPMLKLFASHPQELVRACEQFLLVPQLQSGPSGKLIRDHLRTAKFQVIETLASASDRAAAYASFAEIERPHELALQAIERAIELSQDSWQNQVQYLSLYLQKFSDGPHALPYTLKAAELYEANLALGTARDLLIKTKTLSWTVDQNRQRDEILCRLDTLDRPLEALSSCLLPMTYTHHYAIDLAKQLARQKEAAALYTFITSPAVTALPLRLDDKSALLAAGFEGTETIPNYQNTIKALLYELYAENSSSLSLPTRRLYSIIAYKVAHKALPLYLDLPVFASQSDELLPAIQGKRSAYKELENLYLKVLQTKDPYWGASALSDLATAALNLSQTLQRLPPIDGLDPKVIETELRTPMAQWTARGKSYASSSLKTLENFGLLHENAADLLLDMQRARKDKILWEDRLPNWGNDELF